MRLERQEVMRRFADARVARLGTVAPDGTPHLVPVTFVVVDGAVVFAVDHKPKAGTDLKRLRNIRANPTVSFLVDRYDEDWSRLWWVRADGTASIGDVTRWPAELAALTTKYSQYARQVPDGPLVRTTVTAWRGWSAGGHDPA